MTDDKSEKRIEQLRRYKKFIEKAKEPRVLRHKVIMLETCVQAIKSESTGDIQITAETTLQKIQKFKLNDVTRTELCRWIQTLICKISQD